MRCVHDQHPELEKVGLVVVAWVVLATGGLGTTLADSVGSLGEADRLVVRGMQQIEPDQLRQPLIHDTDLIWLSRPHASRDAYIAAVVQKATLALERAGFATATVNAAVESSDGVERLVVEVVEGPRFEAGSITVTGLPDETTARLVQFLSEWQPSRDAVPRSVNPPDGTTTTTWVTADGLPAPLQPPAWNKAGPAPCDAVTLHQIRVAVTRFLREEGYLSIPLPLPDRRPAGRATRAATTTPRSTTADGSGSHRPVVDVAIKPGERAVDLVVAINDLPPKAVLRRIEVPPECRTTERDLIASLGITIGAAVTDRDRLIWRDSLRRSGRFLKSEIEFRGDPTDPEAAVARFSLEEYAAATPLSQPLSREEATMLRAHDWLMAAIGRGDDLVLDVTRSPAARDDAPPASASARLIVSPAGGFLLTALPDGDQACGLAVTGTDMSLLPADGAGRLDIPLPAHHRLTATVGLSLVRDTTTGTKPPKYNRCGSFKCGISAGRNGTPAGVTIAVPVEPVVCLSLVHENSPQVRFEGDTLVIESAGATSRVDATTGRPLGVSVAGCEVSLDARPGVLDAAVEDLRVASGPNMLRSDAPVGSAVEFLLSGEVAAACRRIADAAGLHGAARSLWESRLTWVVEVVRRCRADGGLERSDRMLASASVGQNADGNAIVALEPLVIPRDDEPTTPAATQKALTRQVAAVVWRLTDEHCGRTSWPAALVRAGACALVGDPAMLDEMAEFMAADEHGPLAYVSASSLFPVPLMAGSLARRGQERLSTVAFHTDCHPLLAAVAPYGLDDCCVSLLRSADDDAVREIGRVACGNPDLLLPLVHSLKSHDRHEDAVAGLQDSLDVWWDGSLRSMVAAKLDAIASPRTATAPGPRDEQPLKK